VEQAKYIPGSCNIGPQERVLRLRIGWAGMAVFLALLIWFHMAPFPKWANLFLFIPALMGAMGLLQYYSHFCVNFGLRGVFNVDKEAFKTENVEQAEYRTLDRKNALKIISTALGIALVITLVAYFI
jgi:hypothetical protein